ncbi:MAG: hypothetical protein NZ889_01875, partial [Candidatus Pacearchaeota archaeon]|nr:hypothetical protein [Candidatus Pacearchaeota archaeon]
YKLINVPPTDSSVLVKARTIARNQGLQYVYTGNVNYEEGSTTFCPSCGKAVIRRSGFYIVKNELKRGKCSCGEKIPGVWR